MASTLEQRAARAAYMREWSARNREKTRATARASRLRNLDKRNAYYAKWAAENKDKIAANAKKWNEENTERAKELKQQWRANNAERVRELKRKRYAEKPEVKAYNEAWSAAHPEVKKASKHNRRAKERSATGKFTGAEFKALCDRYGNRCLKCGIGGKMTADHVLPLAKGGTNHIDNIQPLCRKCNQEKHTKHIDYRLKTEAAA